MRDMSLILNCWGAWAAADSSGVDWQHIAAGFKGLIPYGISGRQQCCDDEGILIDSCLGKLKQLRPEEYEIIIAHFVLGLSLRTIAKKRKCSDGTVRKDLQTALGFVEGMLCILDYKF
ncbi:antitermination protein [Pantoea rodasii]|uniref:Antitermination protein n=1 Tax=Pantoea rodasii TaxID=1076549 RepID=A0A2M9WBR5_9GAMM|nr:antiterminator Q family protein [Pantoea rodasii]PJZ04993.1 antitermination protein [Pantoea rodasii]